MGFGKLNIKAKAKPARGSLDAQSVEEALIDSWEALQDGLDEQEDGIDQQIKDHFNNFRPGSNLGDSLFGEVDEFQSAVANLSADEKMQFFDELFAQEIVDKQSILDSLAANN